MHAMLPSLKAPRNKRAAASSTIESSKQRQKPGSMSLKSKIKALHDWYDRCAIRRTREMRRRLRDTRIYEDMTLRWLRTHAPRRWRVKARDKNRRQEAREWFDSLDFDRSGEISVAELKQPLIAMGFAGSVQDVQDLVDSVDDDGSGEIGFEEFLSILGSGNKANRSSNSGSSRSNDSATLASGSRPSTTLSTNSLASSASATSSIMSNSSTKSRSNGSAIRKLHHMLETGQLGDTEHLELETLLVSYQRSVLTDALFSRGFRAAQDGTTAREKLEHQRTVNALYESFLADEAARKAEQARIRRLEKKQKRKEKKSTVNKKSNMLSALVGIVRDETDEQKGEDVLESEEAAIAVEGGHTHHEHNRNTHSYVPKGARLPVTTSISDINRRTINASRHIHKLGNKRDRDRDEFMIERTKEDTANNSLHAPWTRATCGLSSQSSGMTKEQRLEILRAELKASRKAMRRSIPPGRNTELHKLLIGRPLSTTSFIPPKEERQLVPVKVPVNSAFLMAKRAKLLGKGTPHIVKSSRSNVRLQQFRSRGVKHLV